MFREYLTGRPYPRDTRKTQLSPAVSLSLSHTQPLQINLTWNTGYKRLNIITIKFGMKLKPTKHIVVNYNFTFFNVTICSLEAANWFSAKWRSTHWPSASLSALSKVAVTVFLSLSSSRNLLLSSWILFSTTWKASTAAIHLPYSSFICRWE